MTVNNRGGIYYDADADVYCLHHDWASSDEVCTTIIEAVADITTTPASDIEPLYKSINADGLNILYKPTLDGKLREGDGYTTFTVHDCRVTLYCDGKIEIALSTQSE